MREDVSESLLQTRTFDITNSLILLNPGRARNSQMLGITNRIY